MVLPQSIQRFTLRSAVKWKQLPLAETFRTSSPTAHRVLVRSTDATTCTWAQPAGHEAMLTGRQTAWATVVGVLAVVAVVIQRTNRNHVDWAQQRDGRQDAVVVATIQVGSLVIVDGDSLTVPPGADVHVASGSAFLASWDGRRIRLFGIDAPEGAQRCRRLPVQRDAAAWRWTHCGADSAAHLRRLLGSRGVECSIATVDQYGRAVGACCWSSGATPGARDGGTSENGECIAGGDTDLGTHQVRAGHAVAYRLYSDAYVAHESSARERRAGLWASEFVEPSKWRRGTRLEGEAASAVAANGRSQQGPPVDCGGGRLPIKGNINRRGRRLYFGPHHQNYDAVVINTAAGERWFCDVAEAEDAGWLPA